jgi:AcrR family transcriptional regulator
MPKVSQSHLDARRRQILDAAIECFARDGFHRTTMQDIIDQAQLSTGAIYTYFKSKEDIIEAIAQERHARERDLIMSAGQQGEAGQQNTAETIFQQLAHDFLRLLLVDNEERQRRRVGIQIWGEALRNPRILDIIRQGVDEPRRLLADIVAEAQHRGDFPAGLASDAVARVMIALFQGFILQQAWDENGVEIEPYIEVIEAMIQGLVQNPQK